MKTYIEKRKENEAGPRFCGACKWGIPRPDYNGVDCACEESQFWNNVMEDDASCDCFEPACSQAKEHAAEPTPEEVYACEAEALASLNLAIRMMYTLDVGALSGIPGIEYELRKLELDFSKIAELLELLRFNLFSDKLDWDAVLLKMASKGGKADEKQNH